MPISELPEELFDLVLRECLAPPLDSFFLFPLARGQDSTFVVLERHHHLLLVCKDWRRIGTPLLYSSLRIRRNSDLLAHVAFLQANPTLAQAVESLRMEASLGEGLLPLVQLLPNVRHLYLDVTDRSPRLPGGAERNSELREVLSLLSPTTLYIRDLHRIADNVSLRAYMMKCMTERWSRVTYVCLGPEFSMDEALAIGLGKMPALAELSIAGIDALAWLVKGKPRMGRPAPFMDHILASNSLESLVCRGRVMEGAVRVTVEKTPLCRPIEHMLQFV